MSGRRRRQAAPAPARAAAASANDLPDDVLVAIMGILCKTTRCAAEEAGNVRHHRGCSPPGKRCCRYGTAALVCRRWRQATLAPRLLESLDISLREGGVLDGLRSLATFVQRHAKHHVRHLDLYMEANGWEFDDSVLPILLAPVLAWCSDSLTHLKIFFCMDEQLHLEDVVMVDAWLPHMRSLRSLTVYAPTVRLVGGLSAAPLLQDLVLETDRLDGQGIDSGLEFEEDAVLPASLTRLELGCVDSMLSQQVRRHCWGGAGAVLGGGGALVR